MIPSLLIFAALAAAPGDAAAVGCKLAVLDLEAKALNAPEVEQVKALTDSLAQRVESTSGCRVTSPADLKAMLDLEATKLACGAESSSCMAELGQALGVDELVTGSVARIGAEVVVSVKRVNAKDGSVIRRAEQTMPDLARLRTATLGAVDQLWPSSTPPPSSGGGGLVLGGALAGGGVLVAGTGVVLALVSDGTLRDPKANTAAKDGAYPLGWTGVAAGVVGTVLVVGGAVVMFTGE